MKRISFPSLGFLDSRYVNVTGDSMTGPLWIETGESTLFIVGNTDFEKYVAFYIPEAGFAHPMTLEIYAASDVRFSLSNDIDTLNWQYELIDNAWELSSASQSITLAPGGDLNLTSGGDVVIGANFIPTTDSAIDLGSPLRYFANAYIDKLYLNATATLDGAVAGKITTNAEIRASTTLYRRYYHLPLASFDPGLSGATWTAPTANNLCGWQLNAVGEILEFQSDIHADWDGVSDLEVTINFQLLDAGSADDTVDLKLICYYMGAGDTVIKTQTVEVATTTDGTQYKMYVASFAINYDEIDNVIDIGDNICFVLNLETDTSEIDNVLIVDGKISYNTTHLGIESGDV